MTRSPEETVTAYFSPDTVAGRALHLSDALKRSEVKISPWDNIQLGNQDARTAILTVLAADLSAQIGSSIRVFLLKEPPDELVTAVAQYLSDRRQRAAFVIYDRAEKTAAVSPLVAQLREEKSELHLVELSLVEIRRQVLERDKGLTYLRRQIKDHFDDGAGLYLKGIESSVFEDEKFFGRTELISELLARIHNRKSFAVFGMRRFGKASLLNRLCFVNRLDDHDTVLVNIQILSNEIDLYLEVAREIRKKLDDKYPERLFPREVFKALGWEDYELFRLIKEGRHRASVLRICFTRDIAVLLSRLADTRGILFQKLIILCDEIEHILPDARSGKPGLVGYKHFLAQLSALLSNPFFVVGFSSVGPILERELPFHEYLRVQIQLFPVGMLTSEECNNMVRSIGQERVDFSAESLREIFLATGGNPLLTKILCAEILSIRPRWAQPTVQFEEARLRIESLLAKEQLGPAHSYLLVLFEEYALHYPVEAQLIKDLAQRDGAMEIRSDEHRQRSIEYGFVTAQGNFCKLCSGLLREVLRHRRSLEQTL